MKPILFFSDDITIVPHSVSAELADKLESPITIREFVDRTGNDPVSVYESNPGEIYVVSRPRVPNNDKLLFMEGRAL
jgi:hypothetical protein